MARVVYGSLDLTNNQLLNFLVQLLPSDPTPSEAKLYYNSATKELRYYNGTAWVTLGTAGAGGPPSGAAGGDLSGSYPSPQIAAGVIVDADVNTSAAIAQSKIANLVTDLASKVVGTTQVVAGAGLTGGGDLTASRTIDIGSGTGITVSANAIAADLAVLQARSEKGVANGYAPLDAANLIPTTHLPPLAINDVFIVASDAEMIALVAQVGDMAIRTDTGKTYVLSASPASTLANWKEIMATGQVVSVNGQTGVVSITAASISAVPTARLVNAGNGLTGGGALSADITLNFVGDANLSVTADAVAVLSAPKWTTARSISLTGDITGSAPSVDGSGNVSIATTLAAGAGGKRYAVTLGTVSPQVITHNLNTRDVLVQVYNSAASYEEIEVEVERTTVNTVTIKHNPALPAGYRVVVLA